MTVNMTRVGQHDGQDVHQFTLSNAHNMQATFLTWGAVLQKLELPLKEGPRNIVLGFPHFDDYPAKSPYFGATVGRYGNRIGHGRYAHQGKTYQLDLNQKGEHHLHGGAAGLGRRVWHADIADDGQSVTFRIDSPDGDQGYPGLFRATSRYELTDQNQLIITMSAQCDQTCPVNMVHHSYWNLDGGGTIDQHRLQVPASRFVETDGSLIPTGRVCDVSGRKLDFRQEKQIDSSGMPVFDHTLCLDREEGNPDLAARLTSSDSRVSLTLTSNQPCVQVYTGFKLNLQASDGQMIGPRSGVCLETEIEPDAVNHPHFSRPWLEPGDTYRHVMKHSLTWS